MTENTVIESSDMQVHFDQSTDLLSSIRNYVLGTDVEKVRAVDGVDLTLSENDSQGVIGESGCGKTTLIKTIMGLLSPTGGELRFKGRPVSEFDKADWKRFRRNVQIIFQDPFDSLDPKFTVRETLREPLEVHGIDDKEKRVRETLERVELNPPEHYLDRLPEQLSGGEKQRVSIGRALVLEPDVILADEPVSMLDVSTQASILRLLDRITSETGVSMVYISHDLSTVSYVCDDINVMYLGRIVESGPKKEVLENPQHPYTRALIDAIPIPDPHHDRTHTVLGGSADSPIGSPDGCRFKNRCPERMDVCEVTPRDVPVDGAPDHEVACHLHYDHEAATDGADGPITNGDGHAVIHGGDQ